MSAVKKYVPKPCNMTYSSLIMRVCNNEVGEVTFEPVMKPYVSDSNIKEIFGKYW